MNREKIIQIAMDCNSMMVLEMREMDAKDEFLLEFAASIRAATKEEDARICEEERVEESTVGEIADAQFNLALEFAAAAIRASK